MKKIALFLLLFGIISAMAEAQPANRRQGAFRDRIKNRFPRQPREGQTRPDMQQGQPQNKSMEDRFDKIMKKIKEADPKKYQEIITRFDLNNDGKVDGFEMKRMQAEQKTRKLIIKKHDKNANGKLDEEELAELRVKHAENMQKFASQNSQMYQQVIQGYDENKNNELEIEEWFAAMRQGAIPGPSVGQMGRQGQRPMPGQQPPRPGMPGMHGLQGRRGPQAQQAQQAPQAPQAPQDDGGLLDGIDIEDDSGSDEDVNLDFLDF
jgi:Ca2+-binding EF-hand superfamily protein